MVWVQLIWFVVTTVISIALAPKPKAPRSAAIDDFNFPTAEEGRPIPVAFGTVDITGPNVLWYGDLRTTKIKASSGFSSSTVGYKYYIGFHLGLCHGPVDAVTRVLWGEKAAWTGNITISSGATITQDALFGGKKREGGINGTFTIAMGEDAQVANSYLVSKMGTDVPAFRGITSFIWEGGYVGTTSYVKPVAIRVKRVTSGWQGSTWYIAKAEITGGQMNPAHIVYQLLTDTEWGMGIPSSFINDANFRSVADQLFAEGFGLSLLWTQQATIEQFLQIILDHIAGSLALRNDTGQYELTLMRADYDPDDLDEFGPSEIIELTDFQRVGWGNTVNEVTLVYRDPDTGKDTTISAQDLGNIDAQGGRIPATVELRGISSHAIAAEVVGRELQARSTPMAQLTFTANRDAWRIPYNTCFKFTWPDRDIDQLICRVLTINRGTLNDNSITVKAVQDIYAEDLPDYLSNQNNEDDPTPPPTPDDGPDAGSTIKSSTLSTPPSTPADGDRYFVQTGGTGAWSGHDQQLAEWDADENDWIFTDLPEGIILYDQSTATHVTVNATGGLEEFTAGGAGGGDAVDIDYDDSLTNLNADNVQAAIEGLAARLEGHAIGVRAYANGLFYGQASDLTFYDSADALTWTARNTLGETTIKSLIYYGGYYHGIAGVEVGRSDTSDIYGEWTYTSITDFPLHGINGGFSWTALRRIGTVLYIWTGTLFEKSTDTGATWIEIAPNNLPTLFETREVLRNNANTLFFVFGEQAVETPAGSGNYKYKPQVYSTTDFVTFTKIADLLATPPTSNASIMQVAQHGTTIGVMMRIFDAGDDTLLTMTTNDGASWFRPSVTWPTSVPEHGANGLVWDGSQWVAAGRGWSGVSTNLTVWDFSISTSGLPALSLPQLFTNGAGRTAAYLTSSAGIDGTASTGDGVTWLLAPNLQTTAEEISYDDSTSGIGQPNVQAALDYLAATLGTPSIIGQNASGVHVYKTAAQAIADSTLTAITWPAEDFDTDGYHSTSVNTSRLIAQRDGKYNLGASIRWDSSTTGSRSIFIVKNGVTTTRLAASTQAAVASLTQNVVVALELVAGDYVEVYAYQDSGGSVNVASLEQVTQAWMTRVGVLTANTQIRGATWVRNGEIVVPSTDVYVRFPAPGTLLGWTITTVGGTGSCVIDVWKDTFANFPPTIGDSICAGHKPAISAGTKAEDTDITDWATTAIAAGDVLAFHLESSSIFRTIFFQLHFKENEP